MSLDVTLTRTQPTEVYWGNITHNLTEMAEEAGIYKLLWRPEEIGITEAKQLIDPLETALEGMRRDPDRYIKFNSPNGWGTYDDFVEFVEKYYQACISYPDSIISVSR